MRHITIYKSVTDLVRMEFKTEPLASFYVSENGIERVEYGEEEIPRTVAVFDPGESEGERVTLESNPVRWAELILNVKAAGVDTWVEVGPKNVLTGLVKKILPQEPPGSFYNVENRESLEKFLNAI